MDVPHGEAPRRRAAASPQLHCHAEHQVDLVTMAAEALRRGDPNEIRLLEALDSLRWYLTQVLGLAGALLEDRHKRGRPLEKFPFGNKRLRFQRNCCHRSSSARSLGLEYRAARFTLQNRFFRWLATRRNS